jgi:SulP family sulfate permease
VDRDEPQLVDVMIVARGIHYIDVAGAQVLAQEARRRRKLGGGLYFYRLPDSAQSVLRKGRFIDDIGEENLFPTQTHIVEQVKSLIRSRNEASAN